MLSIEEKNKIKNFLEENDNKAYVMFILALSTDKKLNDIIRMTKSEVEEISTKLSDEDKEKVYNYLKEYKSKDFVFPSNKNETMSRIQAFRILSKAVKDLGISIPVNQTTLSLSKGV
jgi:hypothetical protein